MEAGGAVGGFFLNSSEVGGDRDMEIRALINGGLIAELVMSSLSAQDYYLLRYRQNMEHIWKKIPLLGPNSTPVLHVPAQMECFNHLMSFPALCTGFASKKYP